jgi:WXG100 family type VII secretion target
MTGGVIRVNFNHMDDARDQIAQINRNMQQKLELLTSDLSRMAWEGADKTAFTAAQAKWQQGMQEMNAILQKVPAHLDDARAHYQNALQKSIQGIEEIPITRFA